VFPSPDEALRRRGGKQLRGVAPLSLAYSLFGEKEITGEKPPLIPLCERGILEKRRW
jgi:hypothetical protein